ncbi:MAG: Fe-S-containing protein [bacterium]
MIESFIITLREGIEAALVVAIIVIYLKKSHRLDLVPAAYYGTATACGLSIIAAFFLQQFAFNEEALEGPIYLVAAVLVTTMVIWMWRHGKRLRKALETKIESATQQSHWQGKLGVALVTFLMVFREGVETVLFLGAMALSLNTIWSFVGGLLGLSLAVGFAIFFVRGSFLFDISRFFKVTAVVLLIFVVQLLTGAVHEFFELGVLPVQPEAMRIIGPVVRHNLVFMLAIIAIPTLLVIFPAKQKSEMSPSVLVSQRRWRFMIGTISLVAMGAFGFGIVTMRADTDISAMTFVPLSGEAVEIPVSEVNDGQLHRFMTVVQGDSIRFFVLQVGMGRFATHFDACEPCYGYSRYYVEGGEIICYQCNAVYPLEELTFAKAAADKAALTSSMDNRGCLPVPLPSRLENGMLRIEVSDLAKGANYFRVLTEQ